MRRKTDLRAQRQPEWRTQGHKRRVASSLGSLTRKIGAALLVLFVALAAMPAAALAAEPGERTDFYFQNSAEGFFAYSASLQTGKNALKISNSVLGGGAMVKLGEGSAPERIDTANRFATLVVKNDSTSNYMKIAFIRETDPIAITNERKVNVPLTPLDKDFSFVTVDLGVNSLWSGKVNTLLLECPIGTVSVKSLVFSKQKITYSFGQTRDGFSELDAGTAIGAIDGELVLTSSGKGGAKNENLKIDAARYSAVQLCVRNETQNPISFDFGAVSAERTVPNDGSYYNLVLDFSEEPDWTGEIRELHILIEGGTLRVRNVSFLSEAARGGTDLEPVDETILSYAFHSGTGEFSGPVRNLNEALCLTAPATAERRFETERTAPNLSVTPYLVLALRNRTDSEEIRIGFEAKEGSGSVTRTLSFGKQGYAYAVFDLSAGAGKLRSLTFGSTGTGTLLVDQFEFSETVPDQLDGSDYGKELPETGWNLAGSSCGFWHLEAGNTLFWENNRLVYTFGSERTATVVKTVSAVIGPDIDVNKYIVFRIKNASDAADLTLYWGTNSDPVNTEDKKRSIALKTTETEYTDYLMDLKNVSLFSGYLSGNFFLRFTSTACTGTIEIASIEFFASLEDVVAAGIDYYVAPETGGAEAELPNASISTVPEVPGAARTLLPTWVSIVLVAVGGGAVALTGVLMLAKNRNGAEARGREKDE